MDSGARCFPMMLGADSEQLSIASPDGRPRANLSGAATDYVRKHKAVEDSIFFHILAITNSPKYRKDNEGGLRHSWPRVPLPSESAMLAHSTALGRQLSDLLLADKPVPGVTTGKLRSELKTLAIPTKPGHKTIDPDKDLEVTAGWGHFGVDSAVMPGHGKVTPSDADPEGSVDVWFNDAVCWRNVPRPVWEMTIGGYPVVKKWLSYREKRVLRRTLKMDEVVYVTEMVRRLAAVLALKGELDASYAACAKNSIRLK